MAAGQEAQVIVAPHRDTSRWRLSRELLGLREHVTCVNGSVLNGTRLSIFGVAFLVRNWLEDAAVLRE